MTQAFHERPLCYVAGPYLHPDPVENSHIAIAVGDRLNETGQITAYVPHLSLLWHIVKPHDADYWYEYDLAILACCDALLRIPGFSTGADNEEKFAIDRSIPIFYEESALLQWVSDGRP